jgi:large conductance mechanosensitive channel
LRWLKQAEDFGCSLRLTLQIAARIVRPASDCRGAPRIRNGDTVQYPIRDIRSRSPIQTPTSGESDMGMMQEFKQFALRGNVMDLAVGVIIGGAFGKIVDSIVKDLIMPVVGRIVGGLDFSNYFIKLADGPADVPQTYAELTKAGVPLLAYGNFLTILINFLILAFIIFQMVKIMNRVKKAEPPPPPAATPEDIVLLREIRDSLKR